MLFVLTAPLVLCAYPVNAQGEQISPRKPQTLFVDPAPTGPSILPGAGGAILKNEAVSRTLAKPPYKQPPMAAQSLSASSGDESADEILKHHAQRTRQMQMLLTAMGGGEGRSLRDYFTEEGKQRLFYKLIHHPRFVPFAFVEVCWLLAMFLLPFWISSVVGWKWIARLINTLLLHVYFAGALVGLPLGIFGKELLLLPTFQAVKLLAQFFAN